MNRSFLLIGLLTLAGTVPASAGTLTYTDRGTWASVITSLTSFDGGTQSVGGYTNFNTFAGLIITDLQIVGFNVIGGNTGYELQRDNASGSQPWYQWNSGSILRSADKTASNTAYVRIAFANPVNAFGFNFGAGGSSGAPGSVTIAPDGLSPVNINTNQQPNFTFWGVTSDTQTFSFADVYINDTGRYLVLDDIAKGVFTAQAPPPEAPAETPEPGTFAQFALGAGLVAFARRKF